MELKDQWGKIPKQNKRKRGNSPQQANFNSLDYENYVMSVLQKECKTWHEADRRARILQLRESRRRHLAGEMKRLPSSIELHRATEEDEADFILHGAKGCRPGNPLRRINRFFCPSPPVRQFMDKMWPR